MKSYFFTTFPGQLAQCCPLRTRMGDHEVELIGWASIVEQIKDLKDEEKLNFILSFFMMVLTDQCLYTYFSGSYRAWREGTRFPKFGWHGYGPHNENPFELLNRFEDEFGADEPMVKAKSKEFVQFYLEETRAYFERMNFPIPMEKFTECIKSDKSFAFPPSQLAKSVKNEIVDQTE